MVFSVGRIKGLIGVIISFSIILSVTVIGVVPDSDLDRNGHTSQTKPLDSANVNLTCELNTSQIKKGGDHTYLINVTNTGPTTDTINLTIDNPTNWTAHFNDNPPDGSSKTGPEPQLLATDYRNYSGTLSEIYAIQAAHPDIVNVTIIGTTWEGRDIPLVKVSDNVTVDENEPESLIMGMHHAREWMTVEVVMYFLNHLVDNYGTDPQATWTVDNREIFLAPIVNPDGYIYSQTTGDWRKNRRDNGDGSFGVDLNRNYDGAQNGDPNGNWGEGTGTSHNTFSEVYCGPAPFSEPETQAIRDLVLVRDFKLTISYHSYGREIYWPWGYDTGVQAPHHSALQAVSEGMAAINGYTPMQSAEAYPTTGDTDDWMYGHNWYNLGRFISAHTIELDTSFQPPVSQIDITCELNLGVNYYGIETAGNPFLDSPVITHIPYPDTENNTGPYIISANITTPVGLLPGATELYWNTSGTWNNVVMTNTVGDTWEGSIPGQANGTWVQYYIVTEDLNSHTSAEPHYAPYDSHIFRVGPDVIEFSVELETAEWKIIKFVVEAPMTAKPNEVAVINVIGTSQSIPTETDSVETVTTVHPGILLVDADNPALSSYREALDNNGYIYDEGKANTINLLEYDIVIWPATGSGPLTMTDRWKIQIYLEAGGHLYINGEDIGWQANYEGWSGWYNTYLHAIYIADDSGAIRMNGIPGDVITDGMTDYPVSGSYPSEILPADSETTAIFEYDTDPISNAAIKTDTGTHKLVYIACEYFEGLDLQAKKDLLMYRIVEWLKPPPLTFDIQLGGSPGWNLISYPVDVSGPPLFILNDNAGDGTTTWNMVRWFDHNDPVDPWKTYSPFMPPSLCDLNDINNTMGLWVYITDIGDGFLTVDGQEPTSTTVSLKSGWNLVGYPSITPRIASITLPPTADSMAEFAGADPYHISDVADMTTFTMIAGCAYWVHCNADAVWIVDW